jgi:DegV family protein with EDD domain
VKVQVITDSTSDIPPELAKELGIRIVPIYVRFGDKLYRDGEDIQISEFYRMLLTSPVHPATTQPTPEDFEAVFREYCDKVDGIVSVHISSKISGTYNSALLAKKMLESRCPIEVIDSQFNSGGLALVTMAAARLAQAGKSVEEIAVETRETIKKVHMFGMFETMKYLARSGRVSRAIVSAAIILKVMPLLTFREGEIIRTGLVRSVSKGMDRIYEYVERIKNIAELVIVHSEVPEQAEKLKNRIGQDFPEELIKILQLGAGLGVHGGPGVLLVALKTR